MHSWTYLSLIITNYSFLSKPEVAEADIARETTAEAEALAGLPKCRVPIADCRVHPFNNLNSLNNLNNLNDDDDKIIVIIALIVIIFLIVIIAII